MPRRRLCPVTIAFGDDYGDNVCTFRCSLERGHDGDHVEQGRREGERYRVTWADEATLATGRAGDPAGDR